MPAPRPPSPSAFQPFSHLVAEKAPLYRAVLEVFTEARGRFQSYLRPHEVLSAVRARGFILDTVDEALDALARWGNLSAHPDTAEVHTIEEFYRTRFLYQLTRHGEAVEEAVATYIGALGRTGELQAAALDDVRRYLVELMRLSDQDPLDPSQVFNVLTALQDRFNGLVEQARTFMGGIQRAVDLHDAEAQALLAYKDRLIQYLERFIRQLVTVSAELAELLEGLDEPRIQRLAAAAAARELVDRLDRHADAEAEAVAAWRARIHGLATWFRPEAGMPSQAEELRRRAREAIPALLAAIAAYHDRRVSRSDRVNDYRTLARWFAAAADDGAAHQLWRAAFTLTPARHLAVDEATRLAWDRVPSGAALAWAKAPPLVISPRLRAIGRYQKPGRPDPIRDRSTERALLAARRQQDEAVLAAAEAQLTFGRPFRLSELPLLTTAAFDLLLDLLGDGVAGRGQRVPNSDGRFYLQVSPPADDEQATVHTDRGTFTGPDFTVTLHRANAEAA